MNLTKHFTLEELTFSQTAARKEIDNTPDETVVKNLTHLCESILEPARKSGGNIITVSSGYRSKLLNMAIGGSSTSQHCFGEAADINMLGKKPNELAHIILKLNVDFDQLIIEFGRWVHISKKRYGVNRKQIMIASRINGKTSYEYIKTSDL